MQQSCTYGSVRGAAGDRRPYRDESGDGIRPALHPRRLRCSSFKYAPIFSVLAPSTPPRKQRVAGTPACRRGASPVSVLATTCTTGCCILMLYPPVVPLRTGLLDVGDGHHVYWEVSGNPEGWPVVVLHGGPGGRCTDHSRRWFHPDYFRIVTFDQRGCGRSTPHAGIEHNSTQHLVSDLESLRVVLGIDRWVLMGRSWGSTLALAYAEHLPNRVDAIVVSGVFTARRFELDWLYSADVARAYYRLLTSGTAAAQRAAARAWCAREDAVASTVSTPAASTIERRWRVPASVPTTS